MPESQVANITFALGLDTKEDPWQVPLGNFLSLINSVFTTRKRLTKRNGFALIVPLVPTASGLNFDSGQPLASLVTTFSGNLVSVGSLLTIYSGESEQLRLTGSFQPLSLDVKPLVRRATGQTTVDVAVSSNGLSCSAWLDSDGNSYYQVNDSVTGGTLIAPTSITSATDVSATLPRVFCVGNYFIVTWLATVSAAAALRYKAISTLSLAQGSPTTISIQISSIAAAYDGVVAKIAPDILYLAWDANDGGGAVRLTSISASLAIGSIIVNTATSANLLSAEYDRANNQFWVTIWNASGTVIKSACYSQDLSTRVLDFTSVVTSVTLNNGLTSAAYGGLTIFYEVSNFYGYDNTLRTDILYKSTILNSGFTTAPAIVLRGVGLASKAHYLFSLGKSCMLVCYGSAYQPTYFMIDSSGNVLAKLAYSNGGGYIINQILPQLNETTIGDGTVPSGLSPASSGISVGSVGYLFKDLLASIANPEGPLGSDQGTNKTMGAPHTLPVYTQTGINLATFTFGGNIPNVEAGRILHLGGGYLWMFDGVKPVEHQFHLWPDAIECVPAASAGGMSAQKYFYQGIYYWIDGQGNPQYSAPSLPLSVTVAAGSGLTFTSTFSSGVSTIVVSSAANLFVGQIITDNTTPANITAGTYITSISGTTIGLSQPTAGNSGSPDTLKTVDQGKVTVNFPTLRLTAKTANKVILKGYRWSTANQNFYEFTSVQSPTLNDPSVDYIAIVDTKNDTAIVGNSLIYTTGGVIEDIAAPSLATINQFDDRLFGIDAEDRFTLWYTKQILAGTGAEFSDLLTYYVADAIGEQGPTGPCEVTAPMDDKNIIFKQNAIYYFTGSGPDNTGANSTYSQPTFITATVGCSNPNSVALIDAGLMFQSDKGIWLLGRNLQTSYIGAPVEQFNSNKVTSAKVIPGTTQVRFTLDSGITLMYDYYFGQWGTFSNTPAISSTIYQGLHTYLTKYGQIAQETPGTYLDLSTPVLMGFTTSWLNLASLQGYQRIQEISLLAEYLSPHLINVELAYDYNPSPVQSSVIRPLNFSPSNPSPFGAPTPVGGPGNKEQWRIHAKRQLCESVQLTVTEVFDPSKGTLPGAGFNLSGLNAKVKLKKGMRPIAGKNSVG